MIGPAWGHVWITNRHKIENFGPGRGHVWVE